VLILLEVTDLLADNNFLEVTCWEKLAIAGSTVKRAELTSCECI